MGQFEGHTQNYSYETVVVHTRTKNLAITKFSFAKRRSSIVCDDYQHDQRRK